MFRIRTRAMWFAIACGFVGSCIAIAFAPQSVFPNVALARVEVFADADGLTAQSVRNEVAAPLGAALGALANVRATRAYATTERLELEIDFDPRTDAAADRRAVDDAVNGMRDRLPISHVTTIVEGPEAEPVVTYAFTSNALDQAELARRVRTLSESRFVGTPELARVAVFGGPQSTYQVALDRAQLRAAHISAREVADAVAHANGPRIVGGLVRGDERLSVITGRSLTDVAAIGSIGIDTPSGRVVPLASIARVTFGSDATGAQASFDAKHAVLLGAYARANGDAVALAREIARRVEAMRPDLPSDTQITIAWDQTRLIADSQQALRVEMLVGSAIALLVIAWFLRDVALTLIAAIVLPIALAIAVALVLRFGLRLDLMTLGGLAIAIGLIVDEIIVVIEAIAYAVDADPAADRRATVAGAVRRIARPLVASAAANVVVFLPLALVSGVPGFFFRALAITLSVSVAVSIALSLAVVPSLARAWHFGAARDRGRGRFENTYVACFRAANDRPVLVFGATLAIVAISVALFARAPSDFLPQVNEGAFEVTYAFPPGMSLAAADASATLFERAILLDPAVAHVVRLSGADTNGYVATPPDAGSIRVTLGEGARPPFDRIAQRTRDAIGNLNPYVAVEIHQLLEDQINDLSGAPQPVQLTVRGPEQTELVKIASDLADRVRTVHGIVDTFDGITYESRSAFAAPSDRRTPATARFSADLRATLDGIHATDIVSDRGTIPVVVRLRDTKPIARLASLATPAITSDVREQNGERVVVVTAQIEGADLSTTIADLRARIAPAIAGLPKGYGIDVGGAIVAQRHAIAEFAAVFAIALLLLFGVLLVTFDSFRLPFVVLAAIPTMPIGVALALTITRTAFNVASLMGMLLLAGIVVRSAVLLVDSANRRRDGGATASDAMESAARERLRPIVMTTFAAIGAVAPLALGFGAGSEFERPLAIAVLGGIAVSTLLTLIVVPVLYVAVARET